MPKKLLLADDSVTIQRVIELTFADEDVQVIAVGDGKAAIARIDAERPDVVLADIGMPERDGYEVAAHVKGNPETAHIPVVLLTGAFEPIDEARARAVGCDGVLVKPFEPQMVINRVRDLLAGRRPASLWATPPGPTGTLVTPQQGSGPAGVVTGMVSSSKPEEDDRTAPPASEVSGTDSLDEYFDRLDAAFSEGEPPASSKVDASRAARVPAPVDEAVAEFGSWDLPEPSRPAAPGGPAARSTPAFAQPSAAEQASAARPATSELPTGAPEASPAAQPPELADAFAALLAAERRVGTAPPGDAHAPAGSRALDEATIEEIARRVAARMTEDAVRSTVLDVAERLVRAEIDRIKKQANL